MNLVSTRVLVILAVTAWLGLGLAAAWGFSTLMAPSDLSPQAEAFAKLDPLAKRKVLAAHERFVSLPAETQAQIRQLHEAIQASGRASDLMAVAERYTRFLSSLPPYERVQLQSLPPRERIERTRELFAERQRQKARMEAFWNKWRSEWHRRLFPGELTPEDVAGIARWAEEFGPQYVDALIEHVPPEQRQRIRQSLAAAAKNPTAQREILGWLWLRWQLNFPGKLPPLEPPAREKLLASLTPATRARVAALPEPDQDRIFFRALRYLVASQFAGKSLEGPPPVISEQELALFLQQTLSPERREELFRIEPGERAGRLWWEFLRSRWAEVPEGQPPFVGGRPGGPPPSMGFWPGGPGPFGPGPVAPPGGGRGSPSPGDGPGRPRGLAPGLESRFERPRSETSRDRSRDGRNHREGSKSEESSRP
ncbi:MAG: hypothetical protein NZ899_05485 [Thermoguttaceae bacterium]|nr:hypothetical protein [Thermoguttaceae bacterium]MDW8078232.1 hypothetical protein [Thermoguttaceae bacterium]